jgi:hypothetical protein
MNLSLRRRSICRYVVAGGAVAALLAASRPAMALPISYGDFVGTHVTYFNVTEDPAGLVPLFGTPTVSGNSIAFNPASFAATSAGGSADSAASSLTFTVIAALGSRIGDITLDEVGDTTLTGNTALGSLATRSQAVASGTFAIHEVDFVPISAISIPFSLVFSPSGGSFFLGTDGGGGPLYHTAFSGNATLDVETILAALSVPFEFGATKVSIEWTPTLEALSESGTASIIGVQGFVATTTTIRVREEDPVPVPEPVSLALTGLGLAALALRRRRGQTSRSVPKPPIR